MSEDFDMRNLQKPARENINAPVAVSGNTYLHELCRLDAPVSYIREAVELGADINIVNKDGLPPLGVAIVGGRFEIVECLIALGASIYFPLQTEGEYFHATALAIYYGHLEISRLLLKSGGGFHVNMLATCSMDKDRLSCLNLAVRENCYELIEPLVRAGAFLNRECGRGAMTPLQAAASIGNTMTVQELIAAGAEIDLPQSSTGMTALHYAVLKDNFHAAEILLKAGADPNFRSKDGMTPLHRASEDGGSGIVRALLGAGADPLLRDNFNKTALNHARISGNWRALDILKNAEEDAEQAQIEKQQRKFRR